MGWKLTSCMVMWLTGRGQGYHVTVSRRIKVQIGPQIFHEWSGQVLPLAYLPCCWEVVVNGIEGEGTIDLMVSFVIGGKFPPSMDSPRFQISLQHGRINTRIMEPYNSGVHVAQYFLQLHACPPRPHHMNILLGEFGNREQTVDKFVENACL
jgi:hypothetical protein